MMAAGQATGRQQSVVFEADEERTLAELELAWADGGYHGFCADGGLWSAISSAAAWGAAVRAKPYRKFADKSL
jgi:hypothetical protein